MAPGTTYRRLPGRRRSVAGNASLWLASDHILLVKSSWFREEYKRFYLRDIQAIVVARCARFYVSTPLLVFALVWLSFGAGVAFGAGVGVVWSVATLGLAATWLAISIASSCRCRLYTAVSRDDLPALYRTWTAHRFLSQVRPRIEQVQGAVDPSWAEAERSNAGPGTAPLATAGSPGIPAPSAAGGMTLAAGLFVLSLFVGSLGDFASARFNSVTWLRLGTAIALAQIVCSVAVLIQCRHAKLGRAMQKLAIAALVVIGLMFYIQSATASFISMATANAQRIEVAMTRPFVLVYQIAGGLRLLLGIIGVAILARDRQDEADIIRS